MGIYDDLLFKFLKHKKSQKVDAADRTRTNMKLR